MIEPNAIDNTILPLTGLYAENVERYTQMRHYSPHDRTPPWSPHVLERQDGHASLIDSESDDEFGSSDDEHMRQPTRWHQPDGAIRITARLHDRELDDAMRTIKVDVLVCPTCRAAGETGCGHPRHLETPWAQTVPPMPEVGLSPLDAVRCKNPLCNAAFHKNEADSWGFCVACQKLPKTWTCDNCKYECTLLYDECVCCGKNR